MTQLERTIEVTRLFKEGARAFQRYKRGVDFYETNGGGVTHVENPAMIKELEECLMKMGEVSGRIKKYGREKRATRKEEERKKA